MSGGRDELRRADAARLALALVAVPPRRMIEVRPAIDDLIRAVIAPQPVEVVRPADLVHLTFSFVNLQFSGGTTPQSPPLLARRTRSRAAFLVVDCHPQHVTEAALFETAPKFPVTNPPPPLHLGNGSAPPKDPDVGKKGFDLTNPADLARSRYRRSGRTSRGIRPARVPSHQRVLLYSEEGLIAAMGVLDLSVAPHAAPPARRPVPSGGVLRQRSRRHHERTGRRERARSARPRGGASTHPTGRRTSPRS
jgi:hypothetical protein